MLPSSRDCSHIRNCVRYYPLVAACTLLCDTHIFQRFLVDCNDGLHSLVMFDLWKSFLDGLIFSGSLGNGICRGIFQFIRDDIIDNCNVKREEWLRHTSWLHRSCLLLPRRYFHLQRLPLGERTGWNRHHIDHEHHSNCPQAQRAATSNHRGENGLRKSEMIYN